MFLVSMVCHSMHAQIYQTEEPVGFFLSQNQVHVDLLRKLDDDRQTQIGVQMAPAVIQMVQCAQNDFMSMTTMMKMTMKMIPILTTN